MTGKAGRKLTDNQVRLVRRLWDEEGLSQKRILEILRSQGVHISGGVVSTIVHRTRYTDVPDLPETTTDDETTKGGAR